MKGCAITDIPSLASYNKLKNGVSNLWSLSGFFDNLLRVFNVIYCDENKHPYNYSAFVKRLYGRTRGGSMCMDSSTNSVSAQDEAIYEIIRTIVTTNPLILFKQQQLDEDDFSIDEKFQIAKNIYDKSKLTFFIRFGKYINQPQVNSLDSIFKDAPDLNELKLIIEKLKHSSERRYIAKNVKNRRFEALKRLIQGNSYFSETEMMKRNPLLYEQLVGQYLTQAEIRERDRNCNTTSFVNILLDGIEREHAENTLMFQKEYENNAMEEEESSDDDTVDPTFSEDQDGIQHSSQKAASIYTGEAPHSLWGEFTPSTSRTSDPTTHFQRREENTITHKQNISVTAVERNMLRDEFVSLMYESFLSGNDDYDYTEIDNDEQYDDMDIIGHDEEDKYFDSEEPEDVMPVDDHDSDGFVDRKRKQSSSEDELDIFMSALNNHPTIGSLTADMKKLGK